MMTIRHALVAAGLLLRHSVSPMPQTFHNVHRLDGQDPSGQNFQVGRPFPSLIDMVAQRPKGGHEFVSQFASHPEVAAIKIDAHEPPDKIAAAFWKIRLRGMHVYPGPRWNHRFTLALRDHLAQAGCLTQEVMDAIRGYHTLKLRARRELLLRRNTETELGQKRHSYLKRYRASRRQREHTRIQKMASREASGLSSALPTKDLEPVLDLLYQEFRQRPSPLELEEKFRSVMGLYESRKQASTSLRYFMQRELYTPDEADLACGFRARHLDELDLLQKYRDQEGMFNDQITDKEQMTSVVSDGPEANHTSEPQLHEDDVDDLEHSDWWETEYDV